MILKKWRYDTYSYQEDTLQEFKWIETPTAWEIKDGKTLLGERD